ncbi:MAG: hypothetical protein PHP17_02170 [Candidatus Omnitrophica bacterium]|nr:hypothetical protein [Candidatus Omnitrophota bacterium]
MLTNTSSDLAVLIIAAAFFSLIVYAIIHGRLQAKRDQNQKNK